MEQIDTFLAGLDAQVSALSCLPPDSALRRPRGPLAEELLGVLTSEAAGGFEEATARYRDRFALLALAFALDMEAIRVQASRMERDLAEWDMPASYAREAPPGPRSWFDSVSPQDARPKLMRVLSAHRAAGVPQLNAAQAPPNDYFCPRCLLGELLVLPETADPVRWLQEHRARECAALTLRSLFGAMMPRPPQRRPLLAMNLRQRLKLPRLSLDVRRLAIFPDQFEVTATVRFRTMSTDPAPPFSSAFGLRSVIDDRGSRYLVGSRGGHFQSDWLPGQGRFRGELTLVCWPALGAEARGFRIEADPANVDVEPTLCRCGQTAGLTGTPLGRLAIEVAL